MTLANGGSQEYGFRVSLEELDHDDGMVNGGIGIARYEKRVPENDNELRTCVSDDLDVTFREFITEMGLTGILDVLLDVLEDPANYKLRPSYRMADMEDPAKRAAIALGIKDAILKVARDISVEVDVDVDDVDAHVERILIAMTSDSARINAIIQAVDPKGTATSRITRVMDPGWTPLEQLHDDLLAHVTGVVQGLTKADDTQVLRIGIASQLLRYIRAELAKIAKHETAEISVQRYPESPKPNPPRHQGSQPPFGGREMSAAGKARATYINKGIEIRKDPALLAKEIIRSVLSSTASEDHEQITFISILLSQYIHALKQKEVPTWES